MAYHRVRTERLDGMCWSGVESRVLDGEGEESGVGNESFGGENESNGVGTGGGGGGGSSGGDGGFSAGATGLSPEEEDYVRQYGDLLAAYKGKWTDVDLTGSLEPPRDLFIDVRVLKDAGEIQTEYGYVNSSALRLHWYPILRFC